MEWLRWEVASQDGLVQCTCSSRVACGKTVSSWVLNLSTDGDYTASLGNLFQCLTTLSAEVCCYVQMEFFMYPFWQLPLVLSLGTTEKSLLCLLYTLSSDI